MGPEPIVTLREYLEELIAQERGLREQGDENSEKALVLNKTEVDRRLLILNGAHELAVQVQATYVPREVYDNRIKADDTAREAAAAEARLTAAALATKVEEAKLVAATAVAEAKAAAALALTAALTNLNARLEPLEKMRYDYATATLMNRENRAQTNWTIERVIAIGAIAFAILQFYVNQATP